MVSMSSAAGLRPMMTSPHPYDSPSRIENRISASSSPGLFGWMREPKCCGEPMVTPEPSNALKRREAADESSSVVITFARAAIASLVRPSRCVRAQAGPFGRARIVTVSPARRLRSEEHTSELQSPDQLVCRLLLEKKKLYITAT